jgi:BASS family bile acid:Na+ symporter
MITGALTYRFVSLLSFITPYLIFLMLLLTFCKISLKDIRLHPAHLRLLLIQLAGSISLYFAILPFNPLIAQGAMLCLLAPTATAAAVITGMLGGNVGFLTAYVLFCNVAVALAAPVYFSIANANDALPFMLSVWLICKKVFPLLILPLFLSLFINRFLPKIRKAILGVPKMAFWLWVVALTIVTGNIVHFLVNNNSADYGAEIGLILCSLLLCCLQFFLGRRIGKRFANDPVSSGQGLGQKNTILAIWMAHTYLNPLTALAPAGYILWQNIINSYQLWRKNRSTKDTRQMRTV